MIAEELERAGMIAQVCYDGEAALRFLERHFANLAILDILLPGKDGFEVFEAMQAKGLEVPVIFLSCKNSEVDIVRGLDMGAEDYMTKPFGFAELMARVRAVLRRKEGLGDFAIAGNLNLAEEDFAFGGAEVSPSHMLIRFPNGGAEKIGRKELGILLFLVHNAGVVLTRKAIIHAVWGAHADLRSRSLDQYMVKIRDAFARHDCPLTELKTVHGVGYIYEKVL